MILTATINEVKRRILFDNPQAVVAVKGDYEVNGIAFAFPAIYEDDFDLSTAVKTVYYKATDGIIYNHVVTATDTDTGYPLWVFKDEINKDRKAHNSDLPSHCYLVAQYSEDNGKTWSDTVTVAGTAETGGNIFISCYIDTGRIGCGRIFAYCSE